METRDNQQLTTASLIDRINDGHEAARDELFRRCLPMVRRFAHGRLPAGCRDIAETEDLVQVSLMRALKRVHGFDCRGQGAFFAYLRQITMNAVREEIRRFMRRPEHVNDSQALPASPDSVLGQAVALQTLEAYEAALTQLADGQRAAVIMRMEFDMSYAEIAAELGSPSADAVRMQVARGLRHLAELMP
ncbi:MAG: sigma-70 family RNA polymerase sigma factor [Rhodanobacteraceae bacterium]